MLNRILENWLDNASERSYQNVFCQILSAEGYTILHSTRHSALEYGKDVLAKSPNGEVCAYQLKGNPGSRLTLSQFTAIQNQLTQLVTQPVIFPGISINSHKSFLVTNGYIDEEVQRAIDDLNRAFEKQNSIGRPIEVIQRGDFIVWLKEYGSSLLPDEIKDFENLIKILNADGKYSFPIEIFHKLLSSILFLDTESKEISAAKLKRNVTSAAVLTEICLRNFSNCKNYYAEITAWVMFCV